MAGTQQIADLSVARHIPVAFGCAQPGLIGASRCFWRHLCSQLLSGTSQRLVAHFTCSQPPWLPLYSLLPDSSSYTQTQLWPLCECPTPAGQAQALLCSALAFSLVVGVFAIDPLAPWPCPIPQGPSLKPLPLSLEFVSVSNSSRKHCPGTFHLAVIPETTPCPCTDVLVSHINTLFYSFV